MAKLVSADCIATFKNSLAVNGLSQTEQDEVAAHLAQYSEAHLTDDWQLTANVLSRLAQRENVVRGLCAEPPCGPIKGSTCKTVMSSIALIIGSGRDVDDAWAEVTSRVGFSCRVRSRNAGAARSAGGIDAATLAAFAAMSAARD